MTRSEVIKLVRLEAKKLGLTFKTQNSRINGAQAYRFTDRLTGITVMSNCTLNSAYENSQNGYLSTYDKNTRIFNGIS